MRLRFVRQALALRAPGAYASCARRLRLAKTRIRLGRLAMCLAVAFLSTCTVAIMEKLVLRKTV